MVRKIHKLTALEVKALNTPGRYSDGGNLYLTVSANGGKRWIFRYRFPGIKNAREMGLGSAGPGGVSLSKARVSAEEARDLLEDKIDPIVAKRIAAQAQKAIPTFGDYADRYVESMRKDWKNDKHAAQWVMTLKKYAAPIRDIRIDMVDTDAVIEVLEPIWREIPETAQRLRGRIESILDSATVSKFRDGPNPARWRGHLALKPEIFPKIDKKKVKHHAALPYERILEFLGELRARGSMAARALELTILAATRTSETLHATWDEIDFDAAKWTIPAERTKTGKEHEVPLSPPALGILNGLKPISDGGYVFSGAKPGKPLSSMAMTMQMRRMGFDEFTVHGFRSTFRDWAGETTTFPNHVCEMALAHTISNKSESSYRRGTLLEKRRELMNAWAAFCEPANVDNVVDLHA